MRSFTTCTLQTLSEYQFKGGLKDGAYSTFGRWKWTEKDDDEATMNSATWTVRKKNDKYRFNDKTVLRPVLERDTTRYLISKIQAE